MPLNSRHKNSLANTIRILQGLKAMGDVPYLSPLKPICGLSVAILDAIQATHQIRDDHEELIQRICDLSAAIELEVQDTNASNLPTLWHRVDEITVVLKEILTLLQYEQTLKWYHRLYRTQELRDNITGSSDKLNACIQRFTVTSLLRIQAILLGNQGSIEAYKDSQIVLERRFDSTSTATLYRGRLVSHPTPASVVVKKYDRAEAVQEAFRKEVDRWRDLRHPNLHQVIGVSATTTQHPFILFSDYASGDIINYIDWQLKRDPVDSFMATLRICQGVASGIDYLRSRCPTMSKVELDACLQPSNIAWTPEGRAIVGHNLVADVTTVTSKDAPGQVDAWLKQKFLVFINCINYGSLELSDWHGLMARQHGRRTSHIRMLEHFTSHVIPSFTFATQLYDTLTEQLEASYLRGQLTYKDIRNAALDLWAGAFVYRPATPVQCDIGDIGYMRDDGVFVILRNADDLSPFHITLAQSLMLKSTGAESIEGSPDGTGTLRHHFPRTTFASVRRSRSFRVLDSQSCYWDYLIEKGVRICDEHSTPEKRLNIQDLILITGIEEDLRSSVLDGAGGASGEPIDLNFIEVEDPEPGEPWGYWDVQGGSITHQRWPQNILFIQLEEEDI